MLARLLAAGCLLAAIASCSSDPPRSAPAEPATHTVRYELSGTATSADITMQTGDGQSSQQQHIDVPLTSKATGKQGLTFTMAPGAFFYISAQNNGGGELTCTVYIDDVEYRTARASGEFAIATCSGNVP